MVGTRFNPPYTAIGFVANGHIFGGAVFTDFTGSNINMTIYAPGAISPGIVKALAKFVFVRCNVSRGTVQTRRSNKRVCRMLPKFGFIYEGTFPRWYGPTRADDCVQYRLDKESPILTRMRLQDAST